ncbi:MAG: hypothetical protein V7L25_13865 [Nostoc sp.]|uniref:hypothetical protein n=1 Tax=Nostoc sp. TaxID=1180 RepID=UPI002FF07BF6
MNSTTNTGSLFFRPLRRATGFLLWSMFFNIPVQANQVNFSNTKLSASPTSSATTQYPDAKPFTTKWLQDNIALAVIICSIVSGVIAGIINVIFIIRQSKILFDIKDGTIENLKIDKQSLKDENDRIKNRENETIDGLREQIKTLKEKEEYNRLYL